jgi:hypothetical protein
LYPSNHSFKPEFLHSCYNISALTSDGVLESAVLIKGDDSHFTGLWALVFHTLLVAQAAAEAHRSQAAQEEQHAKYHQQPAGIHEARPVLV